MREIEYNGHKYKILEKLKWRNVKSLMEFGVENLKEFIKHPDIVDYMIKQFIVEPKLTEEILNDMDIDEIVFLIGEVKRVEFSTELLSQIKKKLS